MSAITTLGAEAQAVWDDRLVSARPRYAVMKGALATTSNSFVATTQSPQLLQWQMIAPSQGSVLDRGVMADIDMKIKIIVSMQYDARDPSKCKLYWGDPLIYSRFGTQAPLPVQDFGLCANPLTSLCASQQAAINNTVVNIQTAAVLKELLRMMDLWKNRPLRTSTGKLDMFASYADTTTNSNADPLAGFDAALDAGSVPNGAWQIQYCTSDGTPILDQLNPGSASGTYDSGPYQSYMLAPADFASAKEAQGMVGYNNDAAQDGVFCNFGAPFSVNQALPGTWSTGIKTWFNNAIAESGFQNIGEYASENDARVQPRLAVVPGPQYNAWIAPAPGQSDPAAKAVRGTGVYPDENGQPIFYYKGVPTLHPCMFKNLAGGYIPLIGQPPATQACIALTETTTTRPVVGPLLNDPNPYDAFLVNPTSLTTPIQMSLYLRVRVREPLFLSPFVFNDHLTAREQGLWGLDTVTISLNLQPPTVARLLRFRRTENAPFPSGVTSILMAGQARTPAGWNGADVICNQVPAAGTKITVAGTALSSAFEPGWWLSGAATGQPLYDYGGVRGASPFINATLYAEFLTPPTSLRMPTRCVLPWSEYPYYTTNPGTSILPFGSARIQTNTVTLPCVPDLIMLFARPNVVDVNDGDFYLPITNTSWSFNNQQGLLSAYSVEDLFRKSVQNGLTNTSWQQASGLAIVGRETAQKFSAGELATVLAPFNAAALANYPAAPTKAVGELKPMNAMIPKLTTGFPIVISPALDLGLGDGLAPGVIGNFSIQVTAVVNNPTSVPQTPGLTMIAVNTGFFVAEAGVAYFMRGILTEADVAAADAAGAMTVSALQRRVGGSFATAGSTLAAPRHAMTPIGGALLGSALLGSAGPEHVGHRRSRLGAIFRG